MRSRTTWTSESARRRNADPTYKMRCGFLLDHERRRIVSALRADCSMTEIAAAYGKSVSRISQIAKAAGLQRQRLREQG